MALKIDICGLETGKLPKINSKECLELLKKYQKDGNSEARETLIMSNIRLVLSIIQRYSDTKATSDDLFQAGCIGLIKAIDNFNIDMSVQFSTYAVPMIIGEIRRVIREGNSIKVNRATRDIAYKCMQAREKLSRDMCMPTLMEVAEELNMKEWEVVCAMDAVSEPISLFSAAYADQEDSIMLMEQLSDNKNTEDLLIEKFLLKESIKKLPPRERQIIELRYFIGKTQVEISELVGISQAQVSRLEKNGINRLKREFV